MINGLYDSEDLRYMPDREAALRRRGSRFASALTIVTFVCMVSLLTWAHFAVLDEVTRGEGTVIPSSKTQVIQNLEGGILAEILVREGDIVEPNDILVRIDNTVAEANFRDARSQRYQLMASVARLEAELEGRELVMPEEVLQEAPSAAADQQGFFTLRQKQLAAQIRVLESQASQRKQEIDEMGPRLHAAADLRAIHRQGYVESLFHARSRRTPARCRLVSLLLYRSAGGRRSAFSASFASARVFLRAVFTASTGFGPALRKAKRVSLAPLNAARPMMA